MSNQSSGGGIEYLIVLGLGILVVTGAWKIFEKANQPGWGALIPIYNMILALRVAGKPGWWVILMFVPLVSFVIWILVAAGIARNFGKGVGYTLGLIFVPVAFIPLLGFGNAEYSPTGLEVVRGYQPA